MIDNDNDFKLLKKEDFDRKVLFQKINFLAHINNSLN